MNLFSPYKIINESANELHLAESETRKGFLFFFFRIISFHIIIHGMDGAKY